MNRNSRTAIDILIIFVITAVLSLIAYYGGSAIVRSSRDVSFDMSFTKWEAYYLGIVYIMGIAAGLLLLAWYLAARFFLKVNMPGDGDKRVVWMVVGALTAATSILFPFIFGKVTLISWITKAAGGDAWGTPTGHVSMFSIWIPVLFFVLYTLVGYWGGSLLVTPAPYKYVPFGAKMVRAPKRRK